jgi:hypothetical protein
VIGPHPLDAADNHARLDLPDERIEADGSHVLKISVPWCLPKRGQDVVLKSDGGCLGLLESLHQCEHIRYYTINPYFNHVGVDYRGSRCLVLGKVLDSRLEFLEYICRYQELLYVLTKGRRCLAAACPPQSILEVFRDLGIQVDRRDVPVRAVDHFLCIWRGVGKFLLEDRALLDGECCRVQVIRNLETVPEEFVEDVCHTSRCGACLLIFPTQGGEI